MDMAATFASIATGFSSAFGGPFVSARLHHAGSPVIDDGGSIVTPGTATARTCTAQVDVATDAMRLQDGFVEGDVRIIVLSDGLTGPITTDERCEIMSGIFAGMYSVESVGRDTAGIGFELRGRAAFVPTFEAGPPVDAPEYDPGDLSAAFDGGLS